VLVLLVVFFAVDHLHGVGQGSTGEGVRLA
jgi:hypothetical protein